MKEWGFDEDSKDVDLQRICNELNGRHSIMVHAYLGQLKAKAPVVFGRLKDFAKQKNILNSVKWD